MAIQPIGILLSGEDGLKYCRNQHCLKQRKHDPVLHDTCQWCEEVLNPPFLTMCGACAYLGPGHRAEMRELVNKLKSKKGGKDD